RGTPNTRACHTTASGSMRVGVSPRATVAVCSGPEEGAGTGVGPRPAPTRHHHQPPWRCPMAIQLDHLIVPSRDRVAAARSLAALLDVPWQEAQGPFTPVYVNEGLTLDFAERDRFESHHVCFRVADAEFDAIFGRIQAANIAYRSTPL